MGDSVVLNYALEINISIEVTVFHHLNDMLNSGIINITLPEFHPHPNSI
jgi:hypothetical protein